MSHGKSKQPEKADRPPPTPKQPKPWDAPAPPQKGDETREITYQAIGAALSSWERVESAMGHLFATVLGIGESQSLPAMRAYGAVVSCKGRIDMVAAAAEALFFQKPDQEIETEIDKLLESVRKFSARRNEIAHGCVNEFEIPGQVIANGRGGFLQTTKKIGFMLGASDHSTGKTALTAPETLLSSVGRTTKFAYSSAAIDEFALKFDVLALQIDLKTAAVAIHLENPSSRSSDDILPERPDEPPTD